MEEIIFLAFIGFIAAFIDSIAGGGGLISVPALLSIGLPPQIALGTNKIQSTIASMVSSVGYIKSAKVDKRTLLKLFPFTFIGAIIGVIIINFISNEWLKPIIIVLLIVMMIYTMMKKDWGSINAFETSTKKTSYILILGALVIGVYDGFFGPGTGSFLIFLFLFAKMDFLSSAANAKVLNTISNFVALLTFSFFGFLNWKYGLIMAATGIIGAYFGTKVAVTKGAKLVKPIFIIMTTILIGKQILDYLI